MLSCTRLKTIVAHIRQCNAVKKYTVIAVDIIVVQWVERDIIDAVVMAAIQASRIMMIVIIIVMGDVIDVIGTITGDAHHLNPATTAMGKWIQVLAVIGTGIAQNCSINIYILHHSSEHVNWRNQTPSNKIIVLGLAKHLTETDVSADNFQIIYYSNDVANNHIYAFRVYFF